MTNSGPTATGDTIMMISFLLGTGPMFPEYIQITGENKLPIGFSMVTEAEMYHTRESRMSTLGQTRREVLAQLGIQTKEETIN